MTEGKTKDGIVFNVDERMVNDARFTRKLVKLDSPNISDTAKLNLFYDVLDMLLSGEANTEKFMDDLAAKYDGYCSNEVLAQTLNDILEVAGGKNS